MESHEKKQKKDLAALRESFLKKEKPSEQEMDEEQRAKRFLEGNSYLEEEENSTILNPEPKKENQEELEKLEELKEDENSSLKWYVVRVQSSKEARVKANLERRVKVAGMEDKIRRILVPTELVSEIRKGFKRVIERKLYPGYIMVEMILTDETHYFIKSTPGVGDIVGQMSDTEAERLLLTCDHAKDKPKPKVSFHKGQMIKIKEGAFENYDGIVDEVNEQKGIVKVRIAIFGRYTQVQLGYWQVENI